MKRSKKKIITIDAVPEKETQQQIAAIKVAAYIRVSTELESQENSFESQKTYYEQLIKNHEGWQFAGLYADHGHSGISMKNRGEFHRMIQDATDGKINLILVKSLSRFARNTVDSLTTIRKLKDNGVAVYFEKEAINTMDAVGEFLITLMSSIAQEESHTLAENIRWGKRRQMAKGNYGLPYSAFLGFEKGKDGLKVVPEEAKTVRFIYMAFLMGHSTFHIAQALTAAGIPSPRAGGIWRKNVVTSILTNEKYYGAALLQKRYTEDFLTKKKVKNQGKLPQYYIPNDHPPIVSKTVFDLAQKEIAERSQTGLTNSHKYAFSGKITCGSCGGMFGSKVWHSNQARRKNVWVCNNRWGNEVHCKAPHVNDRDLQETFCCSVSAFMVAHPDLQNGLISTLEQTIKSRKKYGEKENRLAAMRSVIEQSERKFSEEACYVLLERCTVKKGEIVLRLIDGSEYCYQANFDTF